MIQDNATFLAQISPTLQAHQSIGYDLIVISDGWELTQLIKNHWVVPLDHARLPNFSRYAGRSIKNPIYDPGNRYTVVWQSGITAIGYDPRLTGRAQVFVMGTLIFVGGVLLAVASVIAQRRGRTAPA